MLGAVQWVASAGTLPLLAHDDSPRDWLDRCFDLYCGMDRDARMQPLGTATPFAKLPAPIRSTHNCFQYDIPAA